MYTKRRKRRTRNRSKIYKRGGVFNGVYNKVFNTGPEKTAEYTNEKIRLRNECNRKAQDGRMPMLKDMLCRKEAALRAEQATTKYEADRVKDKGSPSMIQSNVLDRSTVLGGYF